MLTVLKGLVVLFGMAALGGVLGLILDYFTVPPETDPYGAGAITYFMCGTAIGSFCALPFLAGMARRQRMSRGKV
jgi:hypothetical protein